MNQVIELRIRNLGAISKDEAAEARLNNKKSLHTLELDWSSSTSSSRKHNEIEVFEVMQPPTTSLEHLFISGYLGVSLPSWLQPQNLTLGSNDAISGSFFCLRDLTISGCKNIVSLSGFLDPASVPVIRKIKINDCTSLVSVPTGCRGDMHSLEELEVINCPNICSQRLVVPSLKRLMVGGNSGNLAHNIDCCSLTYFKFSSDWDTSITLEMWSIPSLEELRISGCKSLTSIGTGGIRAFPSLISLTVFRCAKLSTMDDFLTAEYLPAVENITISTCPELVSLPSERFGTFQSLKDIKFMGCPRVNWQRGLVLPSSLQRLSFEYCEDISTMVPSCLQNLAFLVSLKIRACQGITSIPGNVWESYLPSLKRLTIDSCADLESIGGEEAIAKIEGVFVTGCPKMGKIHRIPSSDQRVESLFLQTR